MRVVLLIILLLCTSLNAYGNSNTYNTKSEKYQANLKTCLEGSYPYLCRHNILTTEDAKLVKRAEYQANLKTCLEGSYPYLCRHNILTTEDAKLVKRAEYQANSSNKNSLKYSTNKKQNKIEAFNRCAENNSCYGDISITTGRPKTTHVRGYYRRCHFQKTISAKIRSQFQ